MRPLARGCLYSLSRVYVYAAVGVAATNCRAYGGSMIGRYIDGQEPVASSGHRAAAPAACDWSGEESTRPTIPRERGSHRNETSRGGRQIDPTVVSFKREPSGTQSLRRVTGVLVGGLLVTMAVAHVTRLVPPRRLRHTIDHPLLHSRAPQPAAAVKEVTAGRPIVRWRRRQGRRAQSLGKPVAQSVRVKSVPRIAKEPAPEQPQPESDSGPQPQAPASEAQFSYLGR